MNTEWFHKYFGSNGKSKNDLQKEANQSQGVNVESEDQNKNENFLNMITDDLNFVKEDRIKQENFVLPEFQYLERLISYRLNKYFPTEKDMPEPVLPALINWTLPMSEMIRENKLNQDEAAVLLIALTPHIQPDLFDRAIESKIHNSGDFPKIGGVRGKNCRFFLPTGETVLFLIAGDDLKRRLEVEKLFSAEHIFSEKKIIWLEDMQNGEPAMHGKLIMSNDYVDLFIHGLHRSPQFSISFPAKRIAPSKEKNQYTWDQLVIPDDLREQIGEIETWINHNDELMNDFGMKGKLRQGYRTLFYGPPGTGKTFAAQILGNKLNQEVYKIDLSMVVSKFIGETEKNLELLFARAEDKNWILFFDEADALFGKRTNIRDAHDKYANQEVSYLLQRIEDFNGLVILATNMKNNIDDAFIRRFNSVLKFPFPEPESRKKIWEKLLPQKAIFWKQPTDQKTGDENFEEVNIPDIVKKYELSGGSILNVVHYASLKGVERFNKMKALSKMNGYDYEKSAISSSISPVQPQFGIFLTDVLEGIQREMIKEGKSFGVVA